MKKASPSLSTTNAAAPPEPAPLSNVHYLKSVPTEPNEPDEPDEQRKPFSFDIIQTGDSKMVLIDACVPAVMATAFLQMLIAFEGGVSAVAAT
jgi:hypothetical protein